MIINLTREQFEAARVRLAQQGKKIEGDSATLEANGVTIGVSFHEPTCNIVTIHKPFYISQSAVDSKIKQWFGQ